MPTVREIAKAAGVSKSTVSLVLNDKPGVSQNMRTHVLSAVNQLENQEKTTAERPNRLNGHQETNTPLSIVVSHPPILRSSQVFSEILHGIQTAANHHGIQLRLVAYDPDASGQQVAQLYLTDPNLRPDGLLVFGGHPSKALTHKAQKQGIPAIVMSREIGDQETSGLGRDEQHWANEAAQHLIKIGHRNIAFIGGDINYGYVKHRLAGYKQALQTAELPHNPNWVVLGHGFTATTRLLAQSPEVTAIIFINDTYAAEGLPAIEAAGLTIPQDISIISFDDTDIARHYDPPLTSIAYHRFEEGQWAVKTLIEKIRFPFIESYHITFKANLITRDSCAPPRAS